MGLNMNQTDLVIKSRGFDPENLLIFNAKELVVSMGTLKIDLNSMQTNLDGIFAAGDIVRGASLVVWAIRMVEMRLFKLKIFAIKSKNKTVVAA